MGFFDGPNALATLGAFGNGTTSPNLAPLSISQAAARAVAAAKAIKSAGQGTPYANGSQQIGGSRQAALRPVVKPGANAPGNGSMMVGGSRRSGLTVGVNAASNQPVQVAAHTRMPPGGSATPPTTASSTPQDPQSIVDASLATLRSQLQGDYSAHVSQGTAALVAASKTLLAMLQGIPAQTSSDYNNMLQQQTTLGQVGSAGLAAANPNGQLQSDLSAVGAPASQQAQLAGQMSNVFNGGAAALLGQTAVIPGQQISTDELAALTHARTLPSIAAMQAQSEIGKFVGTQGTNLQNQLFQIDQTRPGLLQSAQAAINAQQAAQLARGKINPTLSAGRGFLVNDYGEFIPGTNGKPQPYSPASSSSRVFGSAASGYFSLNPSNGKVTQLTNGMPGAKTPKVFGDRVGGYYTIDPTTGQVTRIVGGMPNAPGASSSTMSTVTVNGRVYNHDKAGNFYIPGTTTPVDPNSFGKAAKPASAKQLADASALVQRSARGYFSQVGDTSNTQLTPTQLNAIVKQYNSTVPAGGTKITLGHVLAATNPQDLAALGLVRSQVNQHDDNQIQGLYIHLVRTGIPYRQAFNIVASEFGQWGTHNRAAYFPKGRATQGVASGPSTQAGGFLPQNASFTPGRVDQGRDIQTSPGSPIVAPGDGVVVDVKSDPGGGGGHFGPSYPVVHFTTGPYAGKTIYVGHTTSALRPGQRFKAGDTLSVTGHGGPESGGAPPGWAEIGFAPGGSPGPNGQQPPF